MRRLVLFAAAAAVALLWLLLALAGRGGGILERERVESSREGTFGALVRATSRLEAPDEVREAEQRDQIDVTGSVSPSSLEVFVRHADGAPAAGATVLLVARERELASATCDANGRAELGPVQERAEVFSLDSAAGVARAALEPGEARVELAFDDSAEVTGVVRVDGHEPGEPVTLWLISEWDLPASALPAPVRRTCADVRFREAERFETASDGAFRFRVRRGWRGRLRLPDALSLADGPGAFRLGRPATGLHVDLRTLPRLYGRVLAPDGRTPAAGTFVTASFGGEGRSSWQTSQEDGTFALGFRSRRLEDVRVTFADASGVAYFADLYAGCVALRARGEGFLPVSLPDVALPEDGVVQVVLDPGREIDVEVRGPRGEFVAVEAMSTSRGGSWKEIAPGRYRIHGLPYEPLVVMVSVSGQTLQSAVSWDADRARIDAPAHGSLAIQWTAPTEEWWTGGVRVLLVPWPVTGERGVLGHVEPRRVDGSLAPTVLPVVVPGRYELRLSPERRTSWRSPGTRIPVEVRAGERTELQLAPPR